MLPDRIHHAAIVFLWRHPTGFSVVRAFEEPERLWVARYLKPGVCPRVREPRTCPPAYPEQRAVVDVHYRAPLILQTKIDPSTTYTIAPAKTTV